MTPPKIAGRRGFLAVLPVTNGVAVVADNFWRAKEALAALPVVWDFGAGRLDRQRRVSRRISRRARRTAGGRRRPWRRRRGLRRAREAASRRSTKFRYLAHAPMEPLNATAHWRRTGSTSGWARRPPSPRSSSPPRPAASIRSRCTSTIASSAAASAGGRSTTNWPRRSRCRRRWPSRSSWSGRAKRTSAHDRYRPQAALQAAGGARGRRLAGRLRVRHRGRLDHPLARLGQGRERRRAAGGRGPRQLPLSRRRAQGAGEPEEHPCAGDVLALGRLLAERLRGREFHRRARPRGRAGPAGVPARAARGSAGLPRRARHAGARRAIGASRCRKDVGRGLAIHESFGTIVGEIAEVAVSDGGDQGRSGWSPASIAAMWSIR